MPSHLRRHALLRALVAISLCIGIGSLVASVRPAPAQAAAGRPNIVLLVLDDIPPLDYRLWSRLPQIKARFLNRGIHFENAFGETPLCCPGRAGLLTGLHTYHHGVYRNDARLFDPRVTIATELNNLGYTTFIAGKYFNRTDLIPDKTPRGWDRSTIISGGYFDYDIWTEGVRRFRGRAETDYSTDVIASAALGYLRTAPPDAPIFAYLTPYATHAGKDRTGAKNGYLPAAAPRHIGDPRCAGIPPWRPPSYNEQDVSDKPSEISTLPLVGYQDGWPLERICETLLSVDEMVGSVYLELKAQGRLNNTIWVLTADNGMAFGAHRVPKKTYAYATPIPLWITWPLGRGTSPRVESHYVSNIDFAPTLCSLAGCTMGPYRNGLASADGASFSGLVRDRATTHATTEILEQGPEQVPEWLGLRTTPLSKHGLWHYVEWATGETELYDTTNDPYELENVAGNPSTQDLEAKLSDRLDELRNEPAPSPSPTPPLYPSPEPTPSEPPPSAGPMP